MTPQPVAPAGSLLVREMVAQQMRGTVAAIYRVITYVSLWVLVAVSATFSAVQVWSLRGYLPDELPTPAAWALPIALQVLVLAAELILLSSAVTRSPAVQTTAGAVMVIGYGAEITAHVHEGEAGLVTVTMVVMSALLALSWTLLALALRAGITDADALVAKERGTETVTSTPEPDQAPAAPTRRRRRRWGRKRRTAAPAAVPATAVPTPPPAPAADPGPAPAADFPELVAVRDLEPVDWSALLGESVTPVAPVTAPAPAAALPQPAAEQPIVEHDQEHGDDGQEDGVSDEFEAPTTRLDETEARARIERAFNEGWSTRKAGRYSTRSATYVARVYRELKDGPVYA